MSRIRELDALRGFAVCGIMLVNTWQHSQTSDPVIETLFQGRFYPIFSALFGVSFVLILRTGSRWVLLRRLFWLLCFGLIVRMYYPGEVLTDYAVWGAVALLPASFVPAPLIALLSAAALWAGMRVGGGAALIPGLLLAGMAVMELRPTRRWLLPAFALSAVLSATFTWLWLAEPQSAPLSPWTLYSLAALTGAAAYATGFLLLPRMRIFEPMGRMALTNYVSGTIVITFVTQPVLVVAGVAIVAQALISWWWLRAFRYGPLEWVWRCLTRLERVSFRRDDHRPVPDPGLP
ncbi:DUF418 domain-containing protein [Nonomuraea sp. NPDC050663]|uniref:DUF418 domain-containing protein n=1 Tax=Nonomuraea sp. NPDC050663 TaxID=3364370 RepID=UPI0037AF6D20